MANPLLAPLFTFAGKLRFRTLFLVTAALFAIDVVVPDPILLMDEILLGMGTLLLASIRRPRKG
jgi:hypothetical protein